MVKLKHIVVLIISQQTAKTQTVVETITVARTINHDAVTDILPNFIDSTAIAKLQFHGCWCSKLLNPLDSSLGGPNVVDDLDFICKQWASACKCLATQGGSCYQFQGNHFLEMNVIKNSASSEVENYTCNSAVNSNSCLQDACSVHGFYAMMIVEHFKQNDVTSVGEEITVCEKPNNGRLDNEKWCTGEAPNIYLTDIAPEEVPEISEADAEVRFFEAIENGDIEILRSLISQFPSLLDARIPEPRQPNTDPHTPLTYAAKYGNLESIKYFIEEAGVDISQTGWDGRNSFMMAIRFSREPEFGQNDEIEILEYLNEQDPELKNARDDSSSTPLTLSCERATLAAVQYLVETLNMDVFEEGMLERNCWLSAAILCRLETLQYLNNNYPSITETTDSFGNTASTLATERCQSDVLDYLANI